MMKSTRREFLKKTGAGTAALAAGAGALSEMAFGQATTLPALNFATPESTRQGDMLYRTLGRTNEKVTLIGFGGAHMSGRNITEAESIRLMRSAIDKGITFMDNCWDYGNGVAEERMGKALLDGYRQKTFLMTKFDGRTKAAAARQIEDSLRRLQTDRIDLLQLHEVIRDEDTDRFFAPGGAVEAVREAIQAGKARHFGITGHKAPSFFLRFMEAARRNDLRVEAVMMPLSPLDAHYRSFAQDVIPVCLRDQIAVIAMKTLCAGALFRSNTVSAIEALQYAMTLPTATVVTGLELDARIDQALEATRTFRPFTREQMAGILQRTREAGQNGQFEAFKTGPGFDGTTRNPAWMG